MPRATRITVRDIASLDNLAAATWRAACGKRDRPAVQAFLGDLDASLTRLSADLYAGIAPANRYHSFTIFDPKRRTIHAPVFRDRVVHHAVMARVGPEIERRLIADSYACRIGKGNLAAVNRAQHCIRRYGWYGKLDVRAYFHSIHHQTLKALLRRCIKGSALPLCYRIIDGFDTSPGRGLPIGALSSQYFANWYLGRLDRLLTDDRDVRAVVRYMDDSVFFCDDKVAALRVAQAAAAVVRDELRLELHPGWIQRTACGLSFLGYRIYPHARHLSRRRQQRFRRARARAEQAFTAGRIDARTLQRLMASILAITAYSDSHAWRRSEFARCLPPDA